MALKHLGKQTTAASSPDEAELDTIPYQKKAQCIVRFTCPEFTSLCPATGQPDFAHIIIDYCPYVWLIESKSLKLFLTSFRNHGAYHEDCTLLIAERLCEVLNPTWFRICAYWYPRGGIPIDVFWQSGDPPKGLLIPPLEVPMYRGLG